MYRCLYRKYKYRQVVYEKYRYFINQGLKLYSTIFYCRKALRVIFFELFLSFLAVCEFHFPTEMAI